MASLAGAALLAGTGLAAIAVAPAPGAAAEKAAARIDPLELLFVNGLFPAERLFRIPDSLADDVAGAVFTMTNSTDPLLGNEVVAYNRLADGSLSVAGFFPTGELGGGPAPTSTVFGVPVPATADGLGSEGSLILTEPRADGGRLLFAVNAGSNSVSCFRVEADELGPILSDPNTVASGGLFPASLTFRDTSAGPGVLYVLNSGGGGNVTGFTVSDDCRMRRLRGSQRSLARLINDPPFAEPAPNEVLTTAADIGFTPSGSELVVAIKGGPERDGEGGFEGGIVVFDIFTPDGTLHDKPPTVTEFSADEMRAGPFSFAFTDDIMVLNHANSFTVASYRVRSSGELVRLEEEPLPISNLGDDSPLAFGGFNCWIAIHDGIAYIMTFGDIPATSATEDRPEGLPDGPGVISAVRVGGDGSLSLLDTGPDAPAPGVVAVLPQDDRDAFPDDPGAELFGNHGIDLTVVEDGDDAFLYAVEPRIGQIGAWEINDDGTLTPVGRFSGGLVPGADPFAGTNPGINEFLERCFLQGDLRSPECAQGSVQGIAGF